MPMGVRIALLLMIAAVSVPTEAQTSPAQTTGPAPQLALQYTYLRSNAPVGQCTCFSPEGGSASISLPLPGRHFSLAGDVTAGHTSGISNGNYDLTLTVFTAGLRITPGFKIGRLVPYGQILAGGAHAGGSLVSGNSPANNSSVVFASNAGGGLDLILHPESRVSLRLVEADYLATLFRNGQNDHQNNLRISAGIVIRVGHR
jgi:peptidoglycan-associated lipoprotein